MEVSDLLSAQPNGRLQTTSPAYSQGHQYPADHAAPMFDRRMGSNTTHGSPTRSMSHITAGGAYGPAPAGKHVSFELLLPDSPQHRARLPMRVNIFPHDTTDSIITTVKNFYGLYEGKGVSFEDRDGNTLIARYENFVNNMVVYVRAVPDEADPAGPMEQDGHDARSPKKPRLDEPFQMLPPHPTSRPSSRVARKRSDSPFSAGDKRSASAGTANKARSRSGPKARGSSSQEGQVELTGEALNGYNGYSDSDAGSVSVTSSRRARNEQLASAEISLDNIVEGGRRKRAKFDSSELPLFVPPQVPITTSISSASPHRRVGSHNGASPFSHTNPQTFAYNPPLPSPQSYGAAEPLYIQGAKVNTSYPHTNAQANGHRLRTRGAVQRTPARTSLSSVPGILPTPDPTIGSVISDEDVALQLMRLGDASNFSTHGRTSTSTLDDALSGKAEVASSAGDSDAMSEGDEDDQPETGIRSYASMDPRKKLARSKESFGNGEGAEFSEDEYDDERQQYIKNEGGDFMPSPFPEDAMAARLGSDQHTNSLVAAVKALPSAAGTKAPGKPIKARGQALKAKAKNITSAKPPMSPAAIPSQSRKGSAASSATQQQLGADEEDLSTKPRCQRCRKSKKGCDRQRPCQRCRDAGIGIEGCISEDEGNGRKGRYGRHMGVAVRRGPAEPANVNNAHLPSMASGYQPPVIAAADKSKKRKR